MQIYAQRALAPTTQRLYTVGQPHYDSFSKVHECNPLPASETQLAELVAYFADIVQAAPVTI